MTFGQSISHCLRNFAVFKGRAARSEYWWFVLFTLLVVIGATFLSEMAGNVAAFALLLPYVAVAARRLHDIGKSGWFLLIGFVPIVGSLLLLYWAVKKGDAAVNEYGPSPLALAEQQAALPPGAV